MCPKILCFGDSNTYGYDPRSYLGGRYPKDVRWPGRLEAAGWEVVNEGENGRSIPRLDWETDAAVQAVRRAKPNVLVILLGTNDLLQRPGLGAKVCAERMERFLTALLAEVPAGPRVLLAAPPPMWPGTWVSDSSLVRESRRLAACYEALAKRLDAGFADAGKWNVELSFDGVHFSEAGHRTFAERMSEACLPVRAPVCADEPSRGCGGRNGDGNESLCP